MPAKLRTPVLVGCAVVQQREDDPAKALEPLALMERALVRAADDARAPSLLALADSIRAPRGFWSYADPCRLLAERVGATSARSEIAEVGVLQTTLLGRAASDIAHGRADVVLLTGAEARHRSARASALGVEAPLTEQIGVEPDSVLRPAADIVTPPEIAAGLAMPVTQYAMIENALRASEAQPLDEHLLAVSTLWSGMSRVAASNPDAWRRDPVDVETLRDPGPDNRMLAFPYNKLHCSQWNVDQAAGLILCSLETAGSLGIARDRLVFPLAVADSNAMIPMSERRPLDRSPGFELAGERALTRAGRELSQVAHLELYSCFPAAVRLQQRELGLPRDRPVTVTGGMTFAGGPLNNFVLQALVRMVGVLRADPGSAGMVNAVSGILTKQGVSLWSTEPGPGFAFDDVSNEAARQVHRCKVVADARAQGGTLLTYTVLAQRDGSQRAVLLCDLDDGSRTFVTSDDPELASALMREEFCGRALELTEAGEVGFL